MNNALSPAGMIFMIVTWAAITGLNVFCFYKIFKEKKEEIPDPMPVLDDEGK